MTKFPWTRETRRIAHNAVLKKANKAPVKLDVLDTIEYGDDGIARFTNSIGETFEHDMNIKGKPLEKSKDTLENPDSEKEEPKKAAPKKAAAKK